MTKPKRSYSNRQLLDIGAFALSLWFVYSVITNARDLIEQNIKNAPASYALILALILVVWSWHQNGKKLNVLSIVTLTVLATSMAIWLFGLTT